MSYKTIFTALAKSEAPTLAYASMLAATYDAHLDVMCLGVDNSPGNFFEAGANAVILQNAIERARKEAGALEEECRETLRKSDLRWTTSRAVAAASDISTPVARVSRFSDLAIAPLPYGEERWMQDVLLVEAMMLHAGSPTLCLPPDAKVAPPQTIVIAWNESREALRAVREALPLLSDAKAVHITVIDPPSHGPDRSDPGGALAVMLSRHGIHPSIEVMPKTSGRISDTILNHTAEIGADMVVMGGYGHSRFREAILGGATRDILEHARVPVLLAH